MTTTRSSHRRPVRLSAIVLALVAALALSAAPALAEGGIAEEASRQLDFAKAELEEGEFERARKSAESALRLDPGLFEAMMVKGLALEGTGDKALAEALLRTYIELSGEGNADPAAHRALARLTGTEPPAWAVDPRGAELARIAGSDQY